jgi:hypothetical protein
MMENQELIPIGAIERVNQALSFAQSVQVVEITTVSQAEEASTLFRQLSGHIREVEAERVRVKEEFLRRGREVDAYFKPPQTSLLNFKGALEKAIRAYQQKIEEARRAEQERLNREAAERQRILDEQARVQREKEERLRREAQEATNAEEAAKLSRQADLAAERAAVNEEKASTVVAAVAQPVQVNFSGSSVRANWKFEITDPIALVRHLVDTQQYHLLAPAEPALNAMAKTYRQVKDFPGGRIFNDERLVGRVA